MKHKISIPEDIEIEIEGDDLVCEWQSGDVSLTDNGCDALRAKLEEILAEHIEPGSVVVTSVPSGAGRTGEFVAKMRSVIGKLTVRGVVEL